MSSLPSSLVEAKGQAESPAELSVTELSVTEMSVAEKRALVARLLAKKQAAQAAQAAQAFPVSFAQERLWFIHQLDPASAAYNNRLAVRLRSRLHRAALAATVQAMVDRHETLRTHFATDGDVTVQRVRPGLRFALPEVDLSALPTARREALARRLAGEVGELPFDLGRDASLWRVVLLRLAAEDQVLVMVIHHIISDEWSLEVLRRELAVFYHAFRHRRPQPLAALAVQYADYCQWQRQHLAGATLERQLAFWRRQLGTPPPPLELPLDRPRPAVETARGGTVGRLLPESLHRPLEIFGQGLGATPFMVYLAVFQALLQRFTGQGDFALGTPAANRDRRELEPLIGLFVNTLVVRCQPDPSGGFQSLLGAVRDRALEVYGHQDLPFARLVQELAPPRDANRTPFFQTLFTLQAAAPPEPEAPGDLAVELFASEQTQVAFDASLTVRSLGATAWLTLEYRSDLFDRTTVVRMLAALEVLAAAMVQAPQVSFGRLSVLPRAARQQVLVEWSGGLPRQPPEHFFWQRFAAWAAVRGHQPAVESHGQVVSYGELVVRATALAQRLQRLGAAPEVVVGICLERSVDAALALLAVLRAGAAYLPLDPTYPAERLAFMVEDSGTRLLLTRRSLAAALPQEGVRRVWIDEAEETPGTFLPPALCRDHLAYLLYTSGSTGRAKGSLISHRALVAFCAAAAARLGLASQDRFLQFASLSFDVVVEELFLTWWSGGTVVMGRRRELTPQGMNALLTRLKITVAELPTAFWHEWVRALEEEGQAPPAALSTLIIGGERVPRTALQTWAGLGKSLHHVYGLTETTVSSTFFHLAAGRGAVPGLSGLPIGRPIDNNWIVLTSPWLEPVAAGTPGELLIAGPVLSRGYLGRAALTAQRFIPHPWAASAGQRMYRTGDLARHTAGGELEFLGRVDQQVKVRGFRVEPGEIEAVLEEHPAVAEAAVVVREVADDRRLVAFLTAVLAGASSDHLGAWVGARLPEFMVPSHFIWSDSLPRSPNGKIDRRSLGSLPLPSGQDAAVGGRALHGADEELVAQVWEEVLGGGAVAAEDDFFARGGHSLLATRVVSRLGRRLGVEVPLRTLFERTTVASLAAWIGEERRRGARLVEPPIVPLARRDGRLVEPAPLSFAQEHLWILHQLDPTGAAYNVPMAFRLVGRLLPEALAWAAAKVVERHEVLRSHFTVLGERPVQIVSVPTALPLPCLDLEKLPATRRQEVVRQRLRREAARPFDLSRGPLLRLHLLRLEAEQHVLLLNLHHMVCDEWSMMVVVREVMAFYGLASGEKVGDFPPLAVQYADFAHWQRGWLVGQTLDTLLGYWSGQLQGLTALELPSDRPRPAVESFRGASRSLRLPAALVTEARRLGRDSGATLFMTLLAAFEGLLGRWTGQQEVVVGSPIAQRNRRETEDLVGFFVNMLVLRGDLGRDPTPRQLVARVKEVALDAYTHQDLPFERLVEALSPERDLSRNPLFQVSFQLMNADSSRFELSGLRVEPVATGEVVARFDLSLSLREMSGDGAGDGGIAGVLEYNRDLFDATTMERLLGGYRGFLQAMVQGPDTPCSALPLLSAAQHHQMVQEWNDSARPSAPGVVEQIAAQAARRPHAVVLAKAEEQWTFGFLLARAQGLSGALRRLGVGRETRVAVALEREPEMVMTLLAILAAGGAYVPLDLSLPEQRLRTLVSDGRAAVVVTRGACPWLAAAAAGGPQVLALGASRGLWEGAAEIAPTLPQALAYVLYTSGSTGEPKGVQISQGGLASLVAWHLRAYGVGEDDCASCVAGLGFDATVWEIWPYLAAGARLELADEATRRDPRRLPAWLSARRITLTFLATPLAEAVLEEPWPPGSTLRAVLTGGDRLTRRPKVGQGPPAVLINHYGPTEFTVVATAGVVAPGGLGPPSIGRPIDRARAHVLDRHLRPVPLGAVGELCLAGTSLGRGYLGAPAMTARRWLPDPLAGAGGGRLYRTGDRVRRTVEGELHFLDRGDGQVQLRGFRIEVGEVEAALRDHPAVREAVVVLWRGEGGQGAEARLVAYVAPPTVDWPTVAEFLGRRLPAYMVPTAFVGLDEIPWTTNGKVDRSTLPAPGVTSAGYGNRRRAVGSPFEELISGLYGELLGVERVDAGDDFFALGGHSLLATRLVSRLREVLGVELPLAAVFATPDVAGLAAQVEEAHRRGSRSTLPPLVARQDDKLAELPLSFAQQRLWFLDQLAPGSPLYNIPLAVRLRGALEPARLSACLSALTARHDTLRSTFTASEGSPRLHFRRPEAVALPLVDLRWLAAERRQRRADDLVSEEAGRSFDLARGPLLRALLLRLAEEEHVLVLNLHHIVADGWSMGVLVGDFVALYGALHAGLPGSAAALPELPIRYTDFAAWQQGWLRGAAAESLLATWRRRLAGSPPLLELPTDRPRPAVQSFRGDHYGHFLPAALAVGLTALGRAHGATLFMVLLTAFQTLLARLSGQQDVLVGIPIANRRQAALEGLIGFFVNTLVLRAQPAAGKTFGELLAEVKEVALEAYGHQDLPFERLVEDLQPQRVLSHAPIFQVFFVFQNLAVPALELPGLEVVPCSADNHSAKFDLTLSLAPSTTAEGGPGPLALSWLFSSDLFDATTMRRLGGQFSTLLQQVVAAPSQPLEHFSLLTRVERHQVHREWNDSQHDHQHNHHAEPLLHRVFTRQAARQGEAIAAVYGQQHQSYGDMERRALSLAAGLRRLGVGPDVRVGLAVERSLEMLWALLGVLEAGGTCVPIDPAYPAERRAFLFADAQLAVLLTTRGLLVDPSADGVPILYLEDQVSQAVGEPPSAASPSADSLVYVIYTSGSTGRPKGVAMPHRPLTNLMAWQSADPALQRGVRRMQFSSLSFDGSFREIFVTFGSGGTLLLVPENLRRDIAALLHFIARERVEKAQLPAVVLRLLVRQGAERPQDLASLREMLNCGEQMVVDEAMRRLFELLPGAGLHNHYSPSETHLVAAGALPRRPQHWLSLPTIGRPIHNVQIYLLDRRGEPVPRGVPGELCAGGICPARGYLGRPRQTAQKFVPDPFSSKGGDRLYRTGDLARTRWDGEIEFLGRIDFQIKVRGIRVEPGEIETLLSAQPGVRQVVVVAKSWPGGEARLVAYLVAEEGKELVEESLRAALLVRLPEAMVPSRFVVLPALPLSANRKVDRKALPEPADDTNPALAHVAPRTTAEQQVAAVWGQVLGLERVGVEDDFFALGGHSLLATQVVSRLCRVFAIDSLPVRLLFEKPTVAALAAELEGRARGAPPATIVRQTGPGPFPLSAAQERLWFLHRLDPDSAAYNNLGAARLRGALDVELLRRCLGEIVRRHGSLRTTFVEGERGVGQWRASRCEVSMPRIDLRGLLQPRREELIRALCSAERARPFDLARGPLLRLALLHCSAEENVLLLGVHHIISDGWSQGVFLRELPALYGAGLRGEPSPLPEPAIQYVDFACWQRRWLAEGALERQLAYWQQRLAGPLPVLHLPTDHPRPVEQSWRGRTLPWGCSRELSGALARLAREHGATLYMTLLAGFSLLLHRYSWQEDLLIGCPVANRNRVEVEDLIGFFVNTVVQRIDVSGRPTFATLLARVREVTLESQTHQDLPFERLVEVVAPERDTSRNPLFQVLFQLAPATLVTAEEGGALHMESVAFEDNTAKFDLALALVAGEDRIAGRLQYATDLFESTTMERMLQRFERLLEGVVADAERPLLDYELDEVPPEVSDGSGSATERGALLLPTEDEFDFD